MESHLRARFYNPIVGRFTQEDVYRGDGLNLYAYCGNNPVGYWDPSGYANCDSKTSEWNEFQKSNKNKYSSQREMADAYYKSKGIDPNDLKGRKSLRDQYMGSTPSKDSKTGKEVIDRMDKQGMIKRDLYEEIYEKINELLDSAEDDVRICEFDKAMDKYNQALNLLEDDIEEYDISTMIYASMGDAMYLAGDYDKAKNAFL